MTCLKKDEGGLNYNPKNLSNHFKEFLNAVTKPDKPSMEVIMQGNCINEKHRNALLQPFTNENIRIALFSLDSTKSHRSDGYRSGFLHTLGALLGIMFVVLLKLSLQM